MYHFMYHFLMRLILQYPRQNRRGRKTKKIPPDIVSACTAMRKSASELIILHQFPNVSFSSLLRGLRILTASFKSRSGTPGRAFSLLVCFWYASM